MADPVDMEAPLLGGREENGPAVSSSSSSAQVDSRSSPGGCSQSEATFNLAITAVGAGVLALPKAISTIGAALGLGVVLTVALLTYASTSAIVAAATASKAPTYGAIIQARFGRCGATLLQLSIVVHVGGAMMVYMMIVGDILVGVAPEYNGVLPALTGLRGVWWMGRAPVLLLLTLTVLVPLVSLKSMARLGKAAGGCVAITLCLAASIVALAGTAAVQGKLAPDLVVWPRQARESLWGGSLAVGGRELLGSVAVAALAYTCHFQLTPVHRSLADRSDGAMRPVVRGAVALCCLLYAAVGGAGYALYGGRTAGDVLQNLTLASVAELVGEAAALPLTVALGAAYALNLLVNFALRMWGLRENLAGLLLGPAAAAGLPPRSRALLTYCPLGVVFGLSLAVPSVWFLVELVGSSACMAFAYVFPGMLAATAPDAGRAARAQGGALVGVGLVVAVVGTMNALASTP